MREVITFTTTTTTDVAVKVRVALAIPLVTSYWQRQLLYLLQRARCIHPPSRVRLFHLCANHRLVTPKDIKKISKGVQVISLESRN
jgi:hypothetical protein